MRFWTVPEAQAYIPRLRQLLDVLATATMTAGRARGNGKGAAGAAGPPGGDRPSITPQQAVAELREGSIALRDLSTGLVDFPARDEDGVVYFLCWQRDDDELGWWHLPETGFAGRRRLPRLPRRPDSPPDPDGPE